MLWKVLAGIGEQIPAAVSGIVTDILHWLTVGLRKLAGFDWSKIFTEIMVGMSNVFTKVVAETDASRLGEAIGKFIESAFV